MLKPLFATIRHYLHCSYYSYYSLFAIRDYSLFAIRDYSLFAIRVFQTPLSGEFFITNSCVACRSHQFPVSSQTHFLHVDFARMIDRTCLFTFCAVKSPKKQNSKKTWFLGRRKSCTETPFREIFNYLPCDPHLFLGIRQFYFCARRSWLPNHATDQLSPTRRVKYWILYAVIYFWSAFQHSWNSRDVSPRCTSLVPGKNRGNEVARCMPIGIFWLP